MHTLEATDGTLFHYDSDLPTGDVIIMTAAGEVRVSGESLLQLVAKAYVLPERIKLHEEVGTDSDAKLTELRAADPKELLLGTVF